MRFSTTLSLGLVSANILLALVPRVRALPQWLQPVRREADARFAPRQYTVYEPPGPGLYGSYTYSGVGPQPTSSGGLSPTSEVAGETTPSSASKSASPTSGTYPIGLSASAVSVGTSIRLSTGVESGGYSSEMISSIFVTSETFVPTYPVTVPESQISTTPSVPDTSTAGGGYTPTSSLIPYGSQVSSSGEDQPTSSIKISSGTEGISPVPYGAPTTESVTATAEGGPTSSSRDPSIITTPYETQPLYSTETYTSTKLHCNHNNCLRQLIRASSGAAFCATYTVTPNTETTDLPTYVSHCYNSPSKISSACSCLVTSPVITSQESSLEIGSSQSVTSPVSSTITQSSVLSVYSSPFTTSSASGVNTATSGGDHPQSSTTTSGVSLQTTESGGLSTSTIVVTYPVDGHSTESSLTSKIITTIVITSQITLTHSTSESLEVSSSLPSTYLPPFPANSTTSSGGVVTSGTWISPIYTSGPASTSLRTSSLPPYPANGTSLIFSSGTVPTHISSTNSPHPSANSSAVTLGGTGTLSTLNSGTPSTLSISTAPYPIGNCSLATGPTGTLATLSLSTGVSFTTAQGTGILSSTISGAISSASESSTPYYPITNSTSSAFNSGYLPSSSLVTGGISTKTVTVPPYQTFHNSTSKSGPTGTGSSQSTPQTSTKPITSDPYSHYNFTTSKKPHSTLISGGTGLSSTGGIATTPGPYGNSTTTVEPLSTGISQTSVSGGIKTSSGGSLTTPYPLSNATSTSGPTGTVSLPISTGISVSGGTSVSSDSSSETTLAPYPTGNTTSTFGPTDTLSLPLSTGISSSSASGDTSPSSAPYPTGNSTLTGGPTGTRSLPLSTGSYLSSSSVSGGGLRSSTAPYQTSNSTSGDPTGTGSVPESTSSNSGITTSVSAPYSTAANSTQVGLTGTGSLPISSSTNDGTLTSTPTPYSVNSSATSAYSSLQATSTDEGITDSSSTHSTLLTSASVSLTGSYLLAYGQPASSEISGGVTTPTTSSSLPTQVYGQPPPPPTPYYGGGKEEENKDSGDQDHRNHRFEGSRVDHDGYQRRRYLWSQHVNYRDQENSTDHWVCTLNLVPRKISISPNTANSCSPGGIGHALAREFHAKGPSSSLRKVLTDLENLGMTTLSLEVRQSESIAAVKKEVEALTGGSLHILVNNAGRNCTVPALDVDLDEARDCFETNFFATIALTQAFIPLLISSRGLILNIGSIAAIVPYVFGSVYNASKAALHSFSQTLRLELEPFGVRVMVVITGGVQSRIARTDRTLPEGSLYIDIDDSYQRRLKHSQDGAMPTERYARGVVAAALRGKEREPKWLWRGNKSGLVWFFTKVLAWSWVFDLVVPGMFGLTRLKKIVEGRRKRV
ncbi:hypothetical protein B7494_g5504 [Chlorociboria aeruginascens]|nr:hypothetical protein B7494_g5504 [Chlorociboria aeruginascens]